MYSFGGHPVIYKIKVLSVQLEIYLNKKLGKEIVVKKVFVNIFSVQKYLA